MPYSTFFGLSTEQNRTDIDFCNYYLSFQYDEGISTGYISAWLISEMSKTFVQTDFDCFLRFNPKYFGVHSIQQTFSELLETALLESQDSTFINFEGTLPEAAITVFDKDKNYLFSTNTVSFGMTRKFNEIDSVGVNGVEGCRLGILLRPAFDESEWTENDKFPNGVSSVEEISGLQLFDFSILPCSLPSISSFDPCMLECENLYIDEDEDSTSDVRIFRGFVIFNIV